jgi:O-antigen/teichoic acid export membrane protein
MTEKVPPAPSPETEGDLSPGDAGAAAVGSASLLAGDVLLVDEVAASAGADVGVAGGGGGAAGRSVGALRPGSALRGVRNSAMVLTARLVSRVVALGAVIVVMHSLGSNGFGAMQTAITYSALIAVIADLGFGTLYLREGARRPQLLGRYLDNMLSVRLPLMVLAILVLTGALWLIGLSSLVVASAALLVISGYLQLLRTPLYALQRLRFEIIEIVPEALLLLGFVVLGAATHQGPGYFIWAYVFSYIAACIYFSIVLIRTGIWHPQWRFEMELLRPWLAMSFPLAITYVFTSVYWKIDVPILQAFTGGSGKFTQVGWYQSAYKPFEALLVVPLTLRTVVFPVLSVYHREAPERLQEASRKFFKALVALGLPMALGVIILADQYTSLLSLYPQASPSLRLLGVTVVFMFADNCFATTLLAMDRQRTYAWIAGSGMLINILLNTALIPIAEHLHPGSGYLVTSGNTALTEMGLVLIGWFTVRRLGVRIPVGRLTWRIAVAGAIMGAFLLLVHPEGRIATVGFTLAAALVYLGAAWVLRVADPQEMNLIRRALRRGA